MYFVRLIMGISLFVCLMQPIGTFFVKKEKSNRHENKWQKKIHIIETHTRMESNIKKGHVRGNRPSSTHLGWSFLLGGLWVKGEGQPIKAG